MRWIVLAWVACWLTHCTKEVAIAAESGTSTPKPQIAFEVRHINFSKMFVFYGFYVDAEGNVMAYDAGELGPGSVPGNPAPAQSLIAALSCENRDLLHLDPDEIHRRKALVERARSAKNSDKVNRCFDYGTTQYLAYVFDESSDTYEGIILMQAGDWAFKNTSPEAEALVDWLKTLDVRFADPKCTP